MFCKRCPHCSRAVAGLVCGCLAAQEVLLVVPHRPAIVEFYLDMPHTHHEATPPAFNKLAVAAVSSTAATSWAATLSWRVPSDFP
jgi:hypothetical protein